MVASCSFSLLKAKHKGRKKNKTAYGKYKNLINEIWNFRHIKGSGQLGVIIKLSRQNCCATSVIYMKENYLCGLDYSDNYPMFWGLWWAGLDGHGWRQRIHKWLLETGKGLWLFTIWSGLCYLRVNDVDAICRFITLWPGLGPEHRTEQ